MGVDRHERYSLVSVPSAPRISDEELWAKYAASSLQGLLSNPHYTENYNGPETAGIEEILVCVRAHTDAMLEEHKKRFP